MFVGPEPLIGDSPRVLILGRFPSEKSLRAGEYYANRRNQFWALCEAVFDVSAAAPYPERIEQLLKRGVAVWDVLHACERNGGLEGGVDMQTAKPNDLPAVLARHSSIRIIGLNGRAAAEAFEQFFPQLQYGPARIHTLPSSRAAHEPMPLEEKVQAWMVLREAVGG